MLLHLRRQGSVTLGSVSSTSAGGGRGGEEGEHRQRAHARQPRELARTTCCIELALMLMPCAAACRNRRQGMQMMLQDHNVSSGMFPAAGAWHAYCRCGGREAGRRDRQPQQGVGVCGGRCGTAAGRPSTGWRRCCRKWAGGDCASLRPPVPPERRRTDHSIASCRVCRCGDRVYISCLERKLNMCHAMNQMCWQTSCLLPQTNACMHRIALSPILNPLEATQRHPLVQWLHLRLCQVTCTCS